MFSLLQMSGFAPGSGAKVPEVDAFVASCPLREAIAAPEAFRQAGGKQGRIASGRLSSRAPIEFSRMEAPSPIHFTFFVKWMGNHRRSPYHPYWNASGFHAPSCFSAN
jgi:hypothetical protein